VTRRLVGVLACRLTGTRLYGKPLQNLAADRTILGTIVDVLRAQEFVDDIVLALADEADSAAFEAWAERRDVATVRGHPKDVLGRLIVAAEWAGATDVLRKTTESPFFDLDAMAAAWKLHAAEANDITVVDECPLGTATEFYSLDALRRCHERGDANERSEYVSLYGRNHPEEFRIGLVRPEPACRRTDLRLTVDYPQDLMLCRELYGRLERYAPLVPLPEIVRILDERPDLRALVAEYVHDETIWAQHLPASTTSATGEPGDTRGQPPR
jgi:spore coat polysaccharide biosynthesis protein SpsF